MGHQPRRRSETELTVADLLGNRAQIGFLRRDQDHEVVPGPFLISQEEILAMRRVDSDPVPLGLFDSRGRRVLVPFERDAELTQALDYGLLLRRHFAPNS